MSSAKTILLSIIFLIFGSVGLVFLNNHTAHKSQMQTQFTETESTLAPISSPAVEGVKTETAPPPLEDNCTKTSSKNETNEDGNATNEEHTEIRCQQESGGDSSVNVSNSTNQSAHTGSSSSGQSGSATNTNETHVIINGVEQ